MPSTAVDDLWRAFAQHANYAEFCPSAFGQHQPHRHAFCGWVSARSGKLRRTLYSAQDDELLHDRRQLRCCSGWTRRRSSRPGCIYVHCDGAYRGCHAPDGVVCIRHRIDIPKGQHPDGPYTGGQVSGPWAPSY